MSALFDVQVQPRAGTMSREQIQISDNKYWTGANILTVSGEFFRIQFYYFIRYNFNVVVNSNF